MQRTGALRGAGFPAIRRRKVPQDRDILQKEPAACTQTGDETIGSGDNTTFVVEFTDNSR